MRRLCCSVQRSPVRCSRRRLRCRWPSSLWATARRRAPCTRCSVSCPNWWPASGRRPRGAAALVQYLHSNRFHSIVLCCIVLGPRARRWVKYEESVEASGSRWSKPHVATLGFTCLMELHHALSTGPVLLDVPCNSLDELSRTTFKLNYSRSIPFRLELNASQMKSIACVYRYSLYAVGELEPEPELRAALCGAHRGHCERVARGRAAAEGLPRRAARRAHAAACAPVRDAEERDAAAHEERRRRAPPPEPDQSVVQPELRRHASPPSLRLSSPPSLEHN